MMIRVNMAVSLDGKIAPASRPKLRLSGKADLRRMEELRAWADGIVVGAATIRAEDPPFAITDDGLRASRIGEGRPEHPAVVVLTTDPDPGTARIFTGPGRAVIATTGRAGTPTEDIPEGVEVWPLGKERVEADRLAARLEAEGLERILVEGGGEVAALFFGAGLVDEIWLTVTPWLIGGDDAPGIAEAGRLFDPPATFHLAGIETVPGPSPPEGSRREEHFLIYRKGARSESER